MPRAKQAGKLNRRVPPEFVTVTDESVRDQLRTLCLAPRAVRQQSPQAPGQLVIMGPWCQCQSGARRPGVRAQHRHPDWPSYLRSSTLLLAEKSSVSRR